MLIEKNPEADATQIPGNKNTIYAVSDSNHKRAQVTTFFDLFGELTYTCAFMDRESRRMMDGYSFVHGPVEYILELSETVDALRAATLHLFVNRTNGKGRKNGDFLSPRVVVVDIDTDTTAQEAQKIIDTYGVHWAVRSSISRYHFYWKLRDPLVLEQWRVFQLGLAHRLGGDLDLARVHHAIRVPGFRRVCKSGELFTPELVYVAENIQAMNCNDVLRKWSWIVASAGKAEKLLMKERKSHGRLVVQTEQMLRVGSLEGTNGHASTQALSRQCRVKSTIETEKRNETLYDVIRRHVSKLVVDKSTGALEVFVGMEAALAAGEEINSRFTKGPLDAEEVKKTVESAWKTGCEQWEKNRERLEERRARAKEALCQVVDPEPHSVDSSHTGRTDFFPYDYERIPLLGNRFSDRGVVGRVLQRREKHLLRAGGNLYAFNVPTSTWEIQKASESRALFSFIEQAQYETVADPLFDASCADEKGVISEAKVARAKERIMRLSVTEQVARAVMQRNDIALAQVELFDSHAEVFHCANGVLDLVSATIRPTLAEDYQLAESPVRWERTATCAGWERFLREVFASNDSPEAMVDFMQMLFGYSISGYISEQKIFCHQGAGSNGKSHVFFALRQICGDYFSSIEADIMSSKGHGRVPSLERFGSKIEGKRVVVVDDLDTETVWNEAFVKSLTAFRLRSEDKYIRSHEFENRAAMHLGLQSIPSPETENYGLQRRIMPIPYKRRFEPDPKKGREIEEMIIREAPGILRWAVAGFQKWKTQGGLVAPKEVHVALEEYKRDKFTLTSIIEELFLHGTEGDFMSTGDIADAVNEALSEQGDSAQVSAVEVGRALKRMEFRQARKATVRGFCLKRI